MNNRKNNIEITIPALNGTGSYSSRLSSRSALYTDFTLLVNGQPEMLDSRRYRQLVIDDNILSRASTASRQKIWKELKARYILDENRPLFGAFWNEWQKCESEQERCQTAYGLLALNDLLVADLGMELLFPRLRAAPKGINVIDILSYMNIKMKLHPELEQWSEKTKLAVSQKYLASIRDFGLAKGKLKKTTIRPALYGAPIRLLIRALKLHEIGDSDLITSPIFRLLAIDQKEVIGILSELNQRCELFFKIQGDVVELDLERGV